MGEFGIPDDMRTAVRNRVVVYIAMLEVERAESELLEFSERWTRYAEALRSLANVIDEVQAGLHPAPEDAAVVLTSSTLMKKRERVACTAPKNAHVARILRGFPLPIDYDDKADLRSAAVAAVMVSKKLATYATAKLPVRVRDKKKSQARHWLIKSLMAEPGLIRHVVRVLDDWDGPSADGRSRAGTIATAVSQARRKGERALPESEVDEMFTLLKPVALQKLGAK